MSKILTGLVLLPLLVGGCSSSRTILLSSQQPARLFVDGHQVCEGAGPCPARISRETCWLFDSSLGYVELKAVLPDGRSQVLMAETCALAEGERIHFELTEGELRRE